MDKEDARQLFHAFVGLIALAILLLMGRGSAMAAVFVVIIIGVVLMNLRVRGFDIFPVRWFEESFERNGVPLPGWGSACYAAGVLLLIAFLSDVNAIAAGIIILALGDSVSTMIGRRGKHPIPYNKKKTIEGSAAFLIASLCSAYFIGVLAIPLAIIAAAVESLPGIEDNLSVPIACVVFLLLV